MPGPSSSTLSRTWAPRASRRTWTRPRPLGDELDRVRHEVPHDLLEAVRVAVDGLRLAVERRLEAHAPGLGRRPQRVEGGLDHGAQVDRVDVQPHLPGGDARDVEDVRDQAGLDLGVAVDRLRRLQDRRRVRRAVAEDVAPPHDGVERRPQLVGEDGQELVLTVVRLERRAVELARSRWPRPCAGPGPPRRGGPWTRSGGRGHPTTNVSTARARPRRAHRHAEVGGEPQLAGGRDGAPPRAPTGRASLPRASSTISDRPWPRPGRGRPRSLAAGGQRWASSWASSALRAPSCATTCLSSTPSSSRGPPRTSPRRRGRTALATLCRIVRGSDRSARRHAGVGHEPGHLLRAPQRGLGALLLRDVPRDLRGADDRPRGAADRRDGQRHLDGASLLRDPHRLEVLDPLAAADAVEDRRLLLLPLGGDQEADRPTDELGRRIAEEPLGRRVARLDRRRRGSWRGSRRRRTRRWRPGAPAPPPRAGVGVQNAMASHFGMSALQGTPPDLLRLARPGGRARWPRRRREAVDHRRSWPTCRTGFARDRSTERWPSDTRCSRWAGRRTVRKRASGRRT